MRYIIIFIFCISFGCTNKDFRKINYSKAVNSQEFIDTLIVEQSGQFRVYSTAELNPEWANIDTAYLGKDDDVELFFRGFDNRIRRLVFPESAKKLDTMNVVTGNVTYRQYYDNAARKFIVDISIPHHYLIFGTNRSVEFDIAIGDNDDGIRQKSKIAWASNKDPLKEDKIHGLLVLSDSNQILHNKEMFFVRKTHSQNIDWSKEPKVYINKIVHGAINDDADLSAYFMALSNDTHLQIKIEINDSKNAKFKTEQLLQDNVYVDKGWIEDYKGKKIWWMDLAHSKPGGGARKNRYCDTSIFLSKGKYFVKYSSDESHAFQKWDAPSPDLNFWGIKVYPLNH